MKLIDFWRELGEILAEHPDRHNLDVVAELPASAPDVTGIVHVEGEAIFLQIEEIW